MAEAKLSASSQWFDKAQRDLAAAEKLMSGDGRPLIRHWRLSLAAGRGKSIEGFLDLPRNALRENAQPCRSIGSLDEV